MTADRIDFYRNQMRGVPMADLGRMMWQVLMQATDEAARDEREACAKIVEEAPAIDLVFRDVAGKIRARGQA